MDIENVLKNKIQEYLLSKYSVNFQNIEVLKTRKEFKGHFTVVLFPFLSKIKISPQKIGEEIAYNLKNEYDFIHNYNVIQGFLNLEFKDSFLISLLKNNQKNYKLNLNKELFLIEFSSPNTNKPLHLGHIRNILLGDSISRIFKEVGHDVHKTQIINDRGIHICKSMVAWIKFANNSNPKSENLKGDEFVGKYYVKYNEEYEKQVNQLVSSGLKIDEAKIKAEIYQEAQSLLLKWENGDKKVINLWKKLNNWVYSGFAKTYKSLKVNFDSEYFESKTYLRGKEIILEGLKNKIFFQKEDNSIWVDLTSKGLDEKILLRSDGTSVYITQDIGTAILRNEDHPKMDGMIYTTGNEQDYHFKVFFEIMKLLKYSWADKLKHLSYGMVDLPSGKMKSREGSVVDADELISDMINKAKTISEDLGKLNNIGKNEKEKLYNDIGLAALKYHILKVDPKKRILFNPDDSIDFNGNTGPFIQYTYARIQSLLKKDNILKDIPNVELSDAEREIIIQLYDFKNILINSYDNLNPSIIANHIYDLVKSFNSFYQSKTIIGNSDINKFRLLLSKKVGLQIKKSMHLLGMDVPEKM